MQSNPLKGVGIDKVLAAVHDEIKGNRDGHVASYIPELAKVPPDLFAMCICTVDGRVYSSGDVKHEFSIQSMSKPLTYALALKERGFDFIRTKVNVEPAGGAFDTIDMVQIENTSARTYAQAHAHM